MAATGAHQIRTRVWRNGILEKENFPFEDVSDYLEQSDCLVWADLCDPDEGTIRQLADELSLDEHAVEDALAEKERPKATRFATHLFLTAYSIRHDPDSLELSVGRVSAFTTKRAFVTVRLDDSLDIDAVVARWDDNDDLLKYGPRALVYGLLDEMVDRYFDAIQSLDDAIEDIEDLLFDEDAGAARRVSRTTYTLRRSLVQARRIVLPMREVVSGLMRQLDPNDAELMSYYQDLYDHVLRASEWTESLRDMVSTIFETNLSLSDTRMNEIMKKLTSWAAIIAVPTAVTGFFGQNVPYPGYGHWSGFLVSSLIIVLLAGGLYLGFRRREWL